MGYAVRSVLVSEFIFIFMGETEERGFSSKYAFLNAFLVEISIFCIRNSIFVYKIEFFVYKIEFFRSKFDFLSKFGFFIKNSILITQNSNFHTIFGLNPNKPLPDSLISFDFRNFHPFLSSSTRSTYCW